MEPYQYHCVKGLDEEQSKESPDKARVISDLKDAGMGEPGGYSLPQILCVDEVHQRARNLAGAIYDDFNSLKIILERHELTIQKRWRKKTKEQRRKVLLTAWGGSMPSNHRPDFKDFYKRDQREAGPLNYEAYIFPYINQEDLIKPWTLLLLLNARGRHAPSTFADTDFQNMSFGKSHDSLVPAHLVGYFMLLRDGTDSSSYGVLSPWGDFFQAITRLGLNHEILAGHGLLILEAQTRLMAFLVKCAKQILIDISEGELAASPVQPEPASVASTEIGFASLAAIAAEAPYRVPSQIDFGRIVSLVSAKRDEVVDHIWSLREDPGYFKQCMLEASEHRLEQLKDQHGRTHPDLYSKSPIPWWGRILANEVLSPYVQLEEWSALCSQAVTLQRLQSKYHDRIKKGKPLPEDYMDAILTFRYWLSACLKTPILLLRQSAATSPPCRTFWERESSLDPTRPSHKFMLKPGLSLDEDERSLFCLLLNLFRDKTFSPDIIALLLDELQHLLDRSQRAKALVTSYTAKAIADLSIISECLHQLNSYQPWAQSYDSAMMFKRHAIERNCSNLTQDADHIMRLDRDQVRKILVRYGAPNTVDFQYPVERRKSKETVGMMRNAEANLDMLWNKVDEVLHLPMRDVQNSVIHRLLTEPRALRRTPEWVETSKASRVRLIKDVDILSKPLSQTYNDLQRRTELTVAKPLPILDIRVKAKTRGQSNSQTTAPSADNEVVNHGCDHQRQTVFDVDARALKVFRTLFFTPSLTATPGEVPWTDFIHAMASAGFQIEKLYGSVWQFSPMSSSVERRSIQFHEPHPSGKIPYRVARRHGRRLNRSYGWEGDMFVLAKKK